MSEQSVLSRREFLKLSGIAVSAAALKACTPMLPVAAPAPTAVPPRKPTDVPTQKPVEALFPEMVLVEAGSFQMGSGDGYPDQLPVHTVNIARPFYIAKYEMTFEEYDIFCDDAHRKKPDDRGWGRGNQALIHVDWNEAVAYCNWLSEKAGLTPCYSGKGKLTACDFSAKGYRLPTEAEWEYAARGGRKSQDFLYAGSNDPDEVAWFADNSSDRMHPVGQKRSNDLNLYDMSGNIFEWCWDWYSKEYYAISPADDPQGPPPPETNKPYEFVRVRRSGSWREGAADIRVTTRSFDAMDYPGDNGFRLVRNAREQLKEWGVEISD